MSYFSLDDLKAIQKAKAPRKRASIMMSLAWSVLILAFLGVVFLFYISITRGPDVMIQFFQPYIEKINIVRNALGSTNQLPNPHVDCDPENTIITPENSWPDFIINGKVNWDKVPVFNGGVYCKDSNFDKVLDAEAILINKQKSTAIVAFSELFCVNSGLYTEESGQKTPIEKCVEMGVYILNESRDLDRFYLIKTTKDDLVSVKIMTVTPTSNITETPQPTQTLAVNEPTAETTATVEATTSPEKTAAPSETPAVVYKLDELGGYMVNYAFPNLTSKCPPDPGRSVVKIIEVPWYVDLSLTPEGIYSYEGCQMTGGIMRFSSIPRTEMGWYEYFGKEDWPSVWVYPYTNIKYP